MHHKYVLMNVKVPAKQLNGATLTTKMTKVTPPYKPVGTSLLAMYTAMTMMATTPCVIASEVERTSVSTETNMDRIVHIEAIEIPDMIVKLAEQGNPEVVAGLNSILDQIEEVITEIEENNSAGNADKILDGIDAQLDMLRDMM